MIWKGLRTWIYFYNIKIVYYMYALRTILLNLQILDNDTKMIDITMRNLLSITVLESYTSG